MTDQTENQTEAVEVSTATQTGEPTFHSVIMRINERVAGKNVFKKFLTYGIPTLDMVDSNLPKPDSWEEKELKEGEETAIISSPVYAADHLQYVQDSIIQRLQGLARSRDNAGMEPCTNWTEVAESGGAGTKYPVQLKAFREGFATWLKEVSTYSDVQAAAIMSYTDTKRLLMQDASKKEKFAGVVSQYVESLGDAASEVSSVIAAINRAITTEDEALDW
jgi:hypothetical protein